MQIFLRLLSSSSAAVGGLRLRFDKNKTPSPFLNEFLYFNFGVKGICNDCLWLGELGCNGRLRILALRRIWLVEIISLTEIRVKTSQKSQKLAVFTWSPHAHTKFVFVFRAHTHLNHVFPGILGYLFFFNKKNQPIEINYFFLITHVAFNNFYYPCRILKLISCRKTGGNNN